MTCWPEREREMKKKKIKITRSRWDSVCRSSTRVHGSRADAWAEKVLVLFTTHSSGCESSTRSTCGRKGSQNERHQGTDGKPVGVSEIGRVTSLPHPLSDDDPESKVNGKGDNGGEECQKGGKGHKDGAGSGSKQDAELMNIREISHHDLSLTKHKATHKTPNDGEKGETSADRVQDHDLCKVSEDLRTLGVAVRAEAKNMVNNPTLCV